MLLRARPRGRGGLSSHRAELFTAPCRAGGGFPCAKCPSPAWASLPAAGRLPAGLGPSSLRGGTATTMPCPVLPAAHGQGMLWVPAPGGCSPQWVLPRSHPALGSRSPWRRKRRRAEPCPGGASPLSPVCPSQAVSRDFNRIWVICCSNYQIAFAHPSARHGSSWAAGAEVCAGAGALRAAGHGAFNSTQGRCRLCPARPGAAGLGAGGRLSSRWVLGGAFLAV